MTDKYIIECNGETVRLGQDQSGEGVLAAAQALAEKHQQPAAVYQNVLIIKLSENQNAQAPH